LLGQTWGRAPPPAPRSAPVKPRPSPGAAAPTPVPGTIIPQQEPTRVPPIHGRRPRLFPNEISSRAVGLHPSRGGKNRKRKRSEVSPNPIGWAGGFRPEGGKKTRRSKGPIGPPVLRAQGRRPGKGWGPRRERPPARLPHGGAKEGVRFRKWLSASKENPPKREGPTGSQGGRLGASPPPHFSGTKSGAGTRERIPLGNSQSPAFLLLFGAGFRTGGEGRGAGGPTGAETTGRVRGTQAQEDPAGKGGKSVRALFRARRVRARPRFPIAQGRSRARGQGPRGGDRPLRFAGLGEMSSNGGWAGTLLPF